MINMIMTIANNGVIGNDSKLPWVVPSIVQGVLAEAKGHEVLMGRKTFEFMGNVSFPNVSKTYVLSRRVKTPRIKNVSFINSMEKIPKKGKKEIFVVGGFETFKTCEPYINNKKIVYLIHNDFEGDTRLPIEDWYVKDNNLFVDMDILTGCEVHYSKCVKQY